MNRVLQFFAVFVSHIFLFVTPGSGQSNVTDLVDTVRIHYWVTNVIPKEVQNQLGVSIKVREMVATLDEMGYSIASFQVGQTNPQLIVFVDSSGVWLKQGDHTQLATPDSSKMIDTGALNAGAYGLSKELAEYIFPVLSFSNSIVSSFMLRHHQLALDWKMNHSRKQTTKEIRTYETNWVRDFGKVPFLLTVNWSNGLNAPKFVLVDSLEVTKGKAVLPIDPKQKSSLVIYSNNQVHANIGHPTLHKPVSSPGVVRLILLSVLVASLGLLIYAVRKKNNRREKQL